MLRVDRKGRATRAHRTTRAHPRPRRPARDPDRHRGDARLPRPRPARPHPLLRSRRTPSAAAASAHHRRPRPSPPRTPTSSPRLVHALADWTDPAVLPLDRAADARVLELEAAIEPRLAGDLAHLADWASKLTGATVRIAGLLHLAGAPADGWNRSIRLATVDAAARVGHYYLAHALAVFDHMGSDPLVDDSRAVLDWILRTGTARFTRRDCFAAVRGTRFRKVTDLDPALALLIEHGYLRPVPPPPATTGRPPSPAYDVHPRTEPTQRTEPIAGGHR